MPIYAYACRNCGYTMDALQKMSDDVLVDCPKCGQPELKRQLSAPRFRLKGSGWYETDFKKDNQRNLAGDAGKPKSDDTKTDKADKSKSGGDKSADTASSGKEKA